MDPGVSHFSGEVYTADVTWTTTDSSGLVVDRPGQPRFEAD